MEDAKELFFLLRVFWSQRSLVFLHGLIFLVFQETNSHREVPDKFLQAWRSKKLNESLAYIQKHVIFFWSFAIILFFGFGCLR